MRRKTLSLALAALAAAGTSQLGSTHLFAGDSEIASDIMTRLKANRDAGELKGFTLDMKVEDGIVSFRGQVANDQQQQLVLAAAEDLDGVVEVVNKLAVLPAETTAAATPSKAAPVAAVSPEDAIDFASALSGQAPESDLAPESLAPEPADLMPAMPLPAEIAMPAAEGSTPAIVSPKATVLQASAIDQPQSFAQPVIDRDDALTNEIATALSAAQSAGQLKRFGVDIDTVDGQVKLLGRASSPQQRSMIESIVAGVAGVAGVDNRITVASAAQIAPASHRSPVELQPAPAPAMRPAPPRAQPMGTALPRPAMAGRGPMSQPMAGRRTPAQMASYGSPSYGSPSYGAQVINGERVVPGSIVTNPVGTPVAGGPVAGPVVGAPVMGQPVPMAPAAAVGAPRYDTPNLPSYAWPGYAAYPNYAALTYPQQYSPSAFPYIGPFYPYPQVPLGWRRVALEWDDGWWHLDFSDRSH